MIVNAAKRVHVIVELDRKDLEALLKGETITRTSGFNSDDPHFVSVVVEAYCSEPRYIGE